MDVKAFAQELLQALAEAERFERVTLQTEGPIVDGYAYVTEDLFLRFYFNERTGTIAFALIENGARIWGIDRDNRRGWHVHTAEAPEHHIAFGPLSVADIISRLEKVLAEREGGPNT
jgi:hypothetical protein